MTDAFGIAAVTAVLRRRLEDRVAAADLVAVLGSAAVTAMPPDRVGASGEPTQLNLYLHQVTPNSGWRNRGLPTRDAGGRRIDHPPLALDLHYLLSAYGSDPLHAETLLGHGMLAFHEEPVLSREEVRAALAPAPPDPTLPEEVRDAGLADQVEQVRVSLEVLASEESSRLWSAMQANYRMTAAYVATVVLLVGRRRPTPALPVMTVGAATLSLRRPHVDAVTADGGGPLLATGTVVVSGRNLAGPGVRVTIGDVAVAPDPADVRDTEVRVAVAALPGTLRAGLHPLQVHHEVDLGDPPVGHQVLSSPAAPLTLAPRVTAVTAAVTDTGTLADGTPTADGTITVTLDPPVTAAQRVAVLVNRIGAVTGGSLSVPPGNAIVPPATETATVTAPFTGVPRGEHLVRVQVDGAESALLPDAGGVLDQPQVTL